MTCPVCAARDSRRVAEQNGLGIARCAACEHGYVWPVPPADFLDRLYQEGYYRNLDGNLGFADYDALAPARRRMFARHLDRIERWQRPPGRVLDVGCATGDFLAAAAGRGWEALGVDPSAARSRVLGAGLVLVGTTVHNAAVEKASLDLVTYWDVLEHTPDPAAELGQAASLLRPGGFLALTVPDSANLLARLSGRRWFGFKTAGEHLQFFTRRSLRRALEGTGFEVVSQRPVTWSCTVAFLAARLGAYLGRPGRLARQLLSPGAVGRLVVDVPQINQFALARRTSQAQRSA